MKMLKNSFNFPLCKANKKNKKRKLQDKLQTEN